MSAPYELVAPVLTPADHTEFTLTMHRQYGESQVESDTLSLTVTPATGFNSTRSPLDVLNAVLAVLETAGWQLDSGMSSRGFTMAPVAP
ncbi:hypothetical protein ACFV0C_37125 [Streptomyces sp. NPDC059568]|uniref:hypothetical protein n=1 Tax=Streptomyces sp. NPDC059568 TaxID=3346868 RepID=UPI0036BA2CF8